MKIGLIGCGRVANEHMKIYRYIKNVEVVAVSDIDIKKAKRLADKYKVRNVFQNYLDLLEVKELEFVDVCTPPSTHASVACNAAQFGHNILLEKPMALTTDECEKIIQATRKHGINLCVCHNQIFFPAIRKAKLLIDSGCWDIISFKTSIKENPEMFRVPAWNVSPKEKGILWEAGYHPAYLHLHFLGKIKEVYAVGSRVKYPVFDHFAVFLRTSNKAYGIIEISWLTKKSEKIYEINNSDGKQAYMIASPPYASQGYDTLLEKSGITEEGIYSELKKFLQYLMKTKALFGYFIGHYYLINSFIKSLENGLPPPVQPEEGKETIWLLECIEQSLNMRKAVKVK